jgi:hypothetical protein
MSVIGEKVNTAASLPIYATVVGCVLYPRWRALARTILA